VRGRETSFAGVGVTSVETINHVSLRSRGGCCALFESLRARWTLERPDCDDVRDPVDERKKKVLDDNAREEAPGAVVEE
jgi:hypothetical protein